MFNFSPFEFPTSSDGNYILCLDDAGVLRSRRKQLGLTLQQVSDMAGVQFSQYQRLEAGERSLASCSMRIGLAICAVLLLDPCEMIGISVKQPSVDSLKPQGIFDISPDSKKVGRKQIRTDIMHVYFNNSKYSIMIPTDVLISIGSPDNIEFLWNEKEIGLAIHAVDNPHKDSFDVPSGVYKRRYTALAFYESKLINYAKKTLCWDDGIYAVECKQVRHEDDTRYIMCNLKNGKPSDGITGPFISPSRLRK